MSIFENEITADEAAAITRNYTPGYDEDVVETPEPEDNSPVTAEDVKRLDEGTRDTFDSPFASQDNQSISDRPATFAPPSDWESPVMKQRKRQAMTLPSLAQANDLNQRIAAVMRFDGAPDSVADLAQKARDAVAEARTVHESAQHPDNRRYAVSASAKDDVVLAFAKATDAVRALETHAKDDAVREQWFANVTDGLAKQREAAAKALTTAATAYAAWRQAIAAGEALAVEQGRWGPGWHDHPDARDLKPLDLIESLRKARDIAQSDNEFVSGAYLVTEYDGIPPHTLAKLKRSAEIAGGGTWAQSLYMRLLSPNPADGPAVDTIAQKDLRIINSRPIPALTEEQCAAEKRRAASGMDE